MADLLQTLENNEAILLMYAAGELSEDDRVEVEQLLATDASLRAELDRLVEAQDEVAGQLAELDRTEHLSTGAALQGVHRMMRQWQVDRARQVPVEAKPVKQLRYPWWSYPAASVAMVVLSTLVWFGYSDSPINTTMPPSAEAQRVLELAQWDAAMKLFYSFEGYASSNLQSLTDMESDMNNLPMETAWEF